MNITLLSITPQPGVTSKGQAYNKLELAYKNNTFQGKVEGKTITPFGAGKAAYEVIEKAQPGQTFEITVVKENGFNNWTKATPADAQAASPAQAPQYSGGYQPKAASPAPAGNSRGFETPEERAAKQVYIIRQSSLSAAVGTLSPGAKSALKPEDVIALAQRYTDFVLGNSAVSNPTGFDGMDSDIPE